ncbi:alpha/beta hydrolase [Thalassobaculum sp. OXR-137]|uniref:alpha/beta fold hydrolase n=1 Tax=Thalassobaculum sp. OXR-137 TaxID=3100173 RepID=UPI002AC8BD67|nr:alpha/beta hydrolase [Thalassobaculum sp. OXR-137]WPZ32684.1 alpha/beta hydrolase [Thalassobaculum sp. OXR-137]
MKTLSVNGCDMAYLDLGHGKPLVCVHGSLNDFRAWTPVLKPLSTGRRMIVPSLRHYFPGTCSGTEATFTMAQHVEDVIAFIEALEVGAVDLCGHSRGGHLAFRLALKRPDLVDRLVLAEPGGALDDTLMPTDGVDLGAGAGTRAHVAQSAEKIAAGDLEGGLRVFIEGINGPGAWDRLPAADRQMREDNATTLLAQVNEGRLPFSRAEAEAVTRPTLFIGGADTPGMLPVVLRALAAHVPGAKTAILADAGHSMFRQQPRAFCEAVLGFLGTSA